MSGQIWIIFLVQNDSNYLNVKLEVFKREENRDFYLVLYLKIGGADFNQFMWFMNQLVVAGENFARGENLSQVLISTMSKDMGEPRKLAHYVNDLIDEWTERFVWPCCGTV